jgi:hypothetical protein
MFKREWFSNARVDEKLIRIKYPDTRVNVALSR